MLRGIVSVAVVLGLSIAAQAAITASFASSPTPSLSGYTTYLVNLTTDSGLLTGFEIRFDGPMNQVSPSGDYGVYRPAIYPPLPDPFMDQDSHFLFPESDVISVGESESSTHLAATFAFSGGLSDPNAAASIYIAQIVIADGNTVEMTGKVTVGITEVSLSDFTIPEPASAALLAIGSLGLMLRRRRK